MSDSDVQNACSSSDCDIVNFDYVRQGCPKCSFYVSDVNVCTMSDCEVQNACTASDNHVLNACTTRNSPVVNNCTSSGSHVQNDCIASDSDV